MIYLRAIGLYLSDRVCCWADGDKEPLSFRAALGLVRLMSEVW